MLRERKDCRLKGLKVYKRHFSRCRCDAQLRHIVGLLLPASRVDGKDSAVVAVPQDMNVTCVEDVRNTFYY